uniref:Uncharacterized protein n=1 Tax=Mustela putorius furo TaxID=9669 RepID=M3YGS4_MUSPF
MQWPPPARPLSPPPLPPPPCNTVAAAAKKGLLLSRRRVAANFPCSTSTFFCKLVRSSVQKGQGKPLPTSIAGNILIKGTPGSATQWGFPRSPPVLSRALREGASTAVQQRAPRLGGLGPGRKCSRCLQTAASGRRGESCGLPTRPQAAERQGLCCYRSPQNELSSVN